MWSADGTKIVYVTAVSHENAFHPPKALALIHVIAADGEPFKTIPAPATLVVLNENSVEACVPLGAGFDGALIVPADKGFLLKKAGRTMYYDIVNKAFLTGLPKTRGRRARTAW